MSMGLVLGILAALLLACHPVFGFNPVCPTSFTPLRKSFKRRSLPAFSESNGSLQDLSELLVRHRAALASGDIHTATDIRFQFRIAGYEIIDRDDIVAPNDVLATLVCQHMIEHENATRVAVALPTGPSLSELLALIDNSTEAEVVAASNAALLRLSAFLQLPKRKWDLNDCSFAHAAIRFALAGAKNEALFESLADCTHLFLSKQNSTVSSTAKMLDRHACAGTRATHPLFDIKSGFLEEAGWDSDRRHHLGKQPLVCLYHRGKNIPRLKEIPRTGSFIHPRFKDASLPLMLDIGCGFGSMCLGYAEKWPSSNTLGVEIDPARLRYPRGLASRRGLSDRVQFVCGHALDVIRWLRNNYPGKLAWITLNFPTPYSLSSGGNKWLPHSSNASNFIGNSAMLVEIAAALQEKGGNLFVQSQVEDVAVQLRADAERFGLIAEAGSALGMSEVSSLECMNMTRRGRQYNGSRAVGTGWLAANPLQVLAETEAYYNHKNLLIHRFVLRSKQPSKERSTDIHMRTCAHVYTQVWKPFQFQSLISEQQSSRP